MSGERGSSSERRGAADLASEALAVVREQGLRGAVSSFCFVVVALVSFAVCAVLHGLVAELVRHERLYLRDTFDVTSWDPISMSALVLALAIPAALAQAGPYVASWHRRANALAALVRLTLLSAPDVACALILAAAIAQGRFLLAYHDAPIARIVLAVAWLASSSVLFPLAPAVVFFEPSAGLRATLRRARELARGQRALVLLVRCVPLFVAAGGAFQVAAGDSLFFGDGWGASAALASILGVVAIGASPVVSAVLGIAGYRIAVTSDAQAS